MESQRLTIEQRFAFRLATVLGERDPQKMVDEMNESSPGLWDNWIEFYRTEPFGPEAFNTAMARLAAATGGGSEAEWKLGAVDEPIRNMM